jgi:transposase-like protein
MRRKAVRAQAEAEEERARIYMAEVAKIARREDRESTRLDRSVAERFAVLHNDDDWRRFLPPREEGETPAAILPGNHPRVYAAERSADLRDNFLYQTFFEQLVTSRYPVATYATWSLYVALRAALTLIAERQYGWELLRDHYPPDRPMPLRADAQDYLRTKDIDVEYSQFMAEVMYEVPGILTAAETLLALYSRNVRIEWDRLLRQNITPVTDTPLPDDPGIWTGITESSRLEAAADEYELSRKSVAEVARHFGIGHKRLREYLRDTGRLRKWGGSRYD